MSSLERQSPQTSVETNATKLNDSLTNKPNNSTANTPNDSSANKPNDPSANKQNDESQGPQTVTKNNILEAIKEFDSSIPDAVVHHFLNVADSLQHCKLRGAQGKKTKEKKYTLTIEDLSSALSEYGIEVRRQHYFN